MFKNWLLKIKLGHFLINQGSKTGVYPDKKLFK